MARFRRTLAWHIARRPGGLIALAIQYGHMRTVLDARTSTGYGARDRRGIHGVLDVETALAAADAAARLRNRMAASERISGPAARRAVTSATQAPRFEGHIVPSTFAKKAAKFLARDGVVLFMPEPPGQRSQAPTRQFLGPAVPRQSAAARALVDNLISAGIELRTKVSQPPAGLRTGDGRSGVGNSCILACTGGSES